MTTWSKPQGVVHVCHHRESGACKAVKAPHPLLPLPPMGDVMMWVRNKQLHFSSWIEPTHHVVWICYMSFTQSCKFMLPFFSDEFLFMHAPFCPSSKQKHVHCRCLIGEIRRPGPPINERPTDAGRGNPPRVAWIGWFGGDFFTTKILGVHRLEKGLGWMKPDNFSTGSSSIISGAGIVPCRLIFSMMTSATL